MKGITYSKSPFITAILAPQLKRKNLPLKVVTSYEEFLTTDADYSILDGEELLKRIKTDKKQLVETLSKVQLNLALTTSKEYRAKLNLLDLGVDYCMDMPIATDIVVKTIENAINKSSTRGLKDEEVPYLPQTSFSYMQNEQGICFLSNGTKTEYLSKPERLVLDYLERRDGYASHGEIAYAGWDSFNVRRNTLTATIKKLRQKMIHLKLPYAIKNLYGYGYKLEQIENII